MITAAIDNPALDAAVAHRAATATSHEAFATALASQVNSSGVDQDKQIRESAQQLVATTFIMPLLEQIRQDPFKSDLFHGGFAEDAFGQQLDTILADRIAAKTGSSIADAVYRSIRKQMSSDARGRGLDAHG